MKYFYLILFFSIYSIINAQTSQGGVGINTTQPQAMLHIKGFSDQANQPNLKLVNSSNVNLLTVNDDGSSNGILDQRWNELPDGGSAGQILTTDGDGNLTWTSLDSNNNGTSTLCSVGVVNTSCDSANVGRMRYVDNGFVGVIEGCVETSQNVFEWVSLH